LSSQGSDAPDLQPLGCRNWATSLPYPPRRSDANRRFRLPGPDHVDRAAASTRESVQPDGFAILLGDERTSKWLLCLGGLWCPAWGRPALPLAAPLGWRV